MKQNGGKMPIYYHATPANPGGVVGKGEAPKIYGNALEKKR